MELHQMTNMGWTRFAMMIVASTVVMFLLMYQLVYTWDHAIFSLTRLISAVIMGCAMASVMLAFMWRMYRPEVAKISVLALALVGGTGLLAINRNQTLIDDLSFMKAMIPHHSIAINNARKADIRDPRVRYLADRITRDQIKEITEMRMLIADIEQHGRRADDSLPATPAVLGNEGKMEARDLLNGTLLTKEPL